MLLPFILFQHQSKRMDPLHPDHGLVFRSFIYLYDELKKRADGATYIIKASYLEIYNEKAREREFSYNGRKLDIP